jgi:hypothetical protein
LLGWNGEVKLGKEEDSAFWFIYFLVY